jgi:DNA-binding CsgD family transcriptional regulator
MPDETTATDVMRRDLFVGRQRELETLWAALEGALAGRGGMVMLVGEPGIGKTRTAQQFAAHAAQRGAPVFWGRCYEEPGAPPSVSVPRTRARNRSSARRGLLSRCRAVAPAPLSNTLGELSRHPRFNRLRLRGLSREDVGSFLEGVFGRPPAAEKDALALNARMGARPWLSHTQYDYATMLLARGQAGDREKAVALLDEAMASARALGMHALEERITVQMEPLAARPQTMQAYPNDLSPRGVEVLRLLAVGKSNRDIADTLCISLNTVATHVRNILSKTGSANRTEAAAYALRQDLVEE